ncbi:hypothetical protein BVRB_029220, partial [Beta vulgaris subsp. vulgaris]
RSARRSSALAGSPDTETINKRPWEEDGMYWQASHIEPSIIMRTFDQSSAASHGSRRIQQPAGLSLLDLIESLASRIRPERLLSFHRDTVSSEEWCAFGNVLSMICSKCRTAIFCMKTRFFNVFCF